MTGTADSAHRFDWLAGVATLLAILDHCPHRRAVS